VEALKAATAEDIAQVPGVPEKVAEAVYRFLHEADAAEHTEP
jgi:excinuclease UvrABC nuclease subunit